MDEKNNKKNARGIVLTGTIPRAFFCMAGYFKI